MQKAKVAIVGVSGFGNVHYQDIMRAWKAGLVDIVCATVINAEEEAEKCEALRAAGCEIFQSADAMFQRHAGGVDLCFLPVGIGLHAPMSIAAMRAGMNVFVEKPLAPTVQDADAIIAASKKTGRFAAVGYQHLYQPQIHAMKRAIVEGRIGRLRTVRCIGLWPRDRAYYRRNNWAGRLRGPGGWILDSPVNNALAHYLNLVCYFGGATPDAMADVETLEAGLYRANPEIESFDTAFMKMKTAEDVDLLFVTSHVSESSLNPIIEAIGDGGSIRWTMEGCTAQWADGATETVAMPGPEQMRDNIVAALLARLRDPKAPIFSAERGKVLTSLVNTAHASAPIIPVPREHCFWTTTETEGKSRRVWRGLDGVMNRVFAETRMPTTDDFPFCRNGSLAKPGEMTSFKAVLTE
ncbi:MAG: Gfo/Idh/MocA family protein [Kiritimatiellia bacterium]